MFTTVLVGYDGSQQATGAIDLGRALLAADGTLEVATVRPSAGWVTRGDTYDRGLEDAAHDVLSGAAAHLGAERGTTTRVLPSASPARGLTERAEAIDADLIVLGSTHRGTAGRIVLGTTAQRLLSGAPCAVAIAPKRSGDGEIRHIGVAYDGSPEAEAALAQGYALAEELAAAITVYTVAETFEGGGAAAWGSGWGLSAVDADGVERAQRLAARAAGRAPQRVSPETVLLSGRPGEAIAQAADGIIDLMVIGSRGYGPVRRALLGSVSSSVLAHATFPVLVEPRAAVAADRVPASAIGERA